MIVLREKVYWFVIMDYEYELAEEEKFFFGGKMS